MEFTTIRIHNLIQIYEDARLIQIYARGNKQREGRTEGDAHGEVGGGLLRGRWRVAQPRRRRPRTPQPWRPARAPPVARML